MNRIIFFSGGKGSYKVACYLKETYPNDNIVLYFTDTLWENEDLYRFIYEVSDKLKLPLLYHALGLNPIQLMAKLKILFNSRFGNCSIELKMKVAKRYFKRNKNPPIEKWYNDQFLIDENFKENAILYFGIDFTEEHRTEPIRKNWKPYQVEFPLVDNLFKDNYFKKYDIKRPKLYDLGFSHNNCNGRCVKGGIGHFKNLKDKMPDEYKKLMKQEHHLMIYVSSYHHLKKLDIEDEDKNILYEELDNCYMDYFNGKVDKPKLYIPPNLYIKKYSFMKRKSKPYKLTDLKRENNFTQCDLFDIGGCGCFLD